MAKPKTPLLGELVKGLWPSFVEDIKQAAEKKPMAWDLLAGTKAKVLEWFQGKAKEEKKRFCLKDVVKGLPAEGRLGMQERVEEFLEEGALEYWSGGSTTYLMLTEYFPKEE
jgi:hypothetical protein